MSVALTMGWARCFILTGLHEVTENSPSYSLWIPAAVVMALVNILVMTKGAQSSIESEDAMGGFQKNLFNVSMLTGWALLVSLTLVEAI